MPRIRPAAALNFFVNTTTMEAIRGMTSGLRRKTRLSEDIVTRMRCGDWQGNLPAGGDIMQRRHDSQVGPSKTGSAASAVLLSLRGITRAWAIRGTVCLMLLGSTGCMLPGHGTGVIQHSPDSSVAAWVVYDYITMPLSFEASALQTLHVDWCHTSRPKSTHRLWVSSVGADCSWCHASEFVHLAFSPDSHHLAVVAPFVLKIVDADKGRSWDLSNGETVSSLVWLNNDEVGYAAHT
jgi:hypothetical protein